MQRVVALLLHPLAVSCGSFSVGGPSERTLEQFFLMKMGDFLSRAEVGCVLFSFLF